MTDSHEFTESATVAPGAIGEPGRRTFFLQAVVDSRAVSFRCEKQQVAALCDYLGGIISDLPPIESGELVAPVSAIDPTGFEWTVGRLAVAYEEDADRLVIVAEELIAIDVELPDDFDPDDPDALIALGFDPASARFTLTRAQVAAFIAVGEDIVRAGRPPCPLCGRPVDPDGHPCPNLN